MPLPNQPMIYVSYAEIIETEPQLPGYEEAGPEPSLIEMVRRYYRTNLPDATEQLVEHLVIQYFGVLRDS